MGYVTELIKGYEAGLAGRAEDAPVEMNDLRNAAALFRRVSERLDGVCETNELWDGS